MFDGALQAGDPAPVGRPASAAPAELGGATAAVAMAARRVISEHAWAWLSTGHLLRLADLQRALALVPCSLAALMQVRPSPVISSDGRHCPKRISFDDCLSPLWPRIVLNMDATEDVESVEVSQSFAKSCSTKLDSRTREVLVSTGVPIRPTAWSLSR
jgi:hypothetical protein